MGNKKWDNKILKNERLNPLSLKFSKLSLKTWSKWIKMLVNECAYHRVCYGQELKQGQQGQFQTNLQLMSLPCWIQGIRMQSHMTFGKMCSHNPNLLEALQISQKQEQSRNLAENGKGLDIAM